MTVIVEDAGSLSISASLIGSGSPRAVQVVVSGLSTGAPLTVTAQWRGGQRLVRGGQTAATGAQMEFVEVLVPVNVPVTFVAHHLGQSAMATVTVPWGGGEFLLCALDGSGATSFIGENTGDPRTLGLRVATYAVAGRRSVVTRHDVPTSDVGEWSIVTDDSDGLRALLATGEPIVFRSQTGLMDLPPVLVMQPTGAANVRIGASDYRRWSLSWVEVDDPDADVVARLSTMADFNAIYAGRTMADFNAEWAGLTMADFNVEDWNGRSGL